MSLERYTTIAEHLHKEAQSANEAVSSVRTTRRHGATSAIGVTAVERFEY